jgi:hypothetical protein
MAATRGKSDAGKRIVSAVGYAAGNSRGGTINRVKGKRIHIVIFIRFSNAIVEVGRKTQ